MKIQRSHYQPAPTRSSARRRYMLAALPLLLASTTLPAKPALAASPYRRDFNGFDVSNASIPAKAIQRGGPPRDGIPAIDHPKFVPAAQAKLDASDRVLGLALDGTARAYPVRILNWHEVVNDRFGARRVVVTYCPLCGTGMAFDPPASTRGGTFGVSGLLYNSDVLLYDRATESLWSQILQTAISGPLRGERLGLLPLTHTTWADWRRRHPDTEVLSTDTGFPRDYGRDPYAGYDRIQRLMFDVEHRDDRFPLKEWVLGVQVGGQSQGLPFQRPGQQRRCKGRAERHDRRTARARALRPREWHGGGIRCRRQTPARHHGVLVRLGGLSPRHRGLALMNRSSPAANSHSPTRRSALRAALAGATVIANPFVAAGATRASSGIVSLRAPAPMARLHAGADGALLAVSSSGALWRLKNGAWQGLGRGLDAASPLASGHGRVAGRGVDGGLWVLESGRATQHAQPALAPQAGLLVLALAVIGVAVAPGGRHRVVRLEPGPRGWTETARSEAPVLPDARPVQFDPSGTTGDDDGHVAVFGGPDATRYRHGVLGDEAEATSLLLLERHGLEPMATLVLPEPFVFEDIAPRPVAWRGARALLTVRSGPQGGQLAVAAPDGRQPGRFALAALGEPIGAPQRWMAPTTDGVRLCAVHTPHIGGVLHCYQDKAGKLPGELLARGVTNYAIGRRDLDTSAWVGRHWVAPILDRRGLRILDVASPAAAGASREVELGQAVTALERWAREGQAGVAVLLQDGSVVWTATA